LEKAKEKCSCGCQWALCRKYDKFEFTTIVRNSTGMEFMVMVKQVIAGYSAKGLMRVLFSAS
jgi:hypothetical protein